MKLYKILDIREADYGCEECPKDGPHAILILDDGKRIEVSEKWIADNGIKEGKLLHIKEDGSISGDLVLKEHEAAKWLTKDELDNVNWLPADVTLIEKIREVM